MDKKIWLDGVMGVVVGDALGVPVEFTSRMERTKDPVTGMREYGTHNQPKGTWSDDSSLMLAMLDSLIHSDGLDYEDMMVRFRDWRVYGKYTPHGTVFDIGITCANAIGKYRPGVDPLSCGASGEHDNGNGSLMRIFPACLYAYEKGLSDDEAIKVIHEVSGLTHNHLRSKMACGLYYFCIKQVLDRTGSLRERLQQGMEQGFSYYERSTESRIELSHYSRLRNLNDFALVSDEDISSSGYVVASIEAAIWCLIKTQSLKDCLLLAVNLGDDTDTVGAIAGGIAGLFYGYDNIPEEWLSAIQQREWIEDLCKMM